MIFAADLFCVDGVLDLTDHIGAEEVRITLADPGNLKPGLQWARVRARQLSSADEEVFEWHDEAGRRHAEEACSKLRDPAGSLLAAYAADHARMLASGQEAPGLLAERVETMRRLESVDGMGGCPLCLG